MKEKLKQKAIQSISWILDNTMTNGKWSVWKITWFAAGWYGLFGFLKALISKVLKFSVMSLIKLDEALPGIIRFLEALVSALSYHYKKEFFLWTFQRVSYMAYQTKNI